MLLMVERARVLRVQDVGVLAIWCSLLLVHEAVGDHGVHQVMELMFLMCRIQLGIHLQQEHTTQRRGGRDSEEMDGGEGECANIFT